MEEAMFRAKLSALMEEFVGSARAERFMAKGDGARVIGDSQVDIDDQSDFWARLHQEFNIIQPWSAEEVPSSLVLRIRNVFWPAVIYEMPDLTVKELRAVVADGFWPPELIKKSKAR